MYLFVLHSWKTASNHPWTTSDSACVLSFPTHTFLSINDEGTILKTNNIDERLSPWNLIYVLLYKLFLQSFTTVISIDNSSFVPRIPHLHPFFLLARVSLVQNNHTCLHQSLLLKASTSVGDMQLGDNVLLHYLFLDPSDRVQHNHVYVIHAGRLSSSIKILFVWIAIHSWRLLRFLIQ